MNTIDVIYYFESQAAKQAAIFAVFMIDNEDEAILNTEIDDGGNITKLDNWNQRWRVSTQAPGVELHNTRMSLHNFQKIIDANIEGFTILVAGYPEDDVETMLAKNEYFFYKRKYAEEDNLVKTATDLTITDEDGQLLDHRIAPTKTTCDKYRELYPENVTVEIDAESIVINRGNFSNHGS